MSRDKQIEEMAKDLLSVSRKVSNIIMEETHEFLSQNHKYSSLKEFHEAHKKGRNVMEAEFLTELGYAKASDVAREIIADLERIIEVNKDGEAKFDIMELRKIEKKYITEEGE